MSLSLLNLNNGSAPEPAQNNTISLREYAGGPMPQADMEQNLVNLRGRINALINGLSTTDSNVSQNNTNLSNEISNLSSTLNSQISAINTQLSGSGNIDAQTLDVSGAVTTGALTVDQNFKIKAGNSHATFLVQDDYEALTIKPRTGNSQASVLFQDTDLEIDGDAQIEGNLIVQGQILGNGREKFNFLDEELLINNNEDGNKVYDLSPYVSSSASMGIFTVRQPAMGDGFVHTPRLEIRYFTNSSFSGNGHHYTLHLNDRGITAGGQFNAPIINGKAYIRLFGDTWSTRTTHQMYFNGYYG